MGANTQTAADPGNVSMDLSPTLVGATYPITLTDRAITLLHELTHTIYEARDYPVKDFTYRRSWGQGYLPDSIGWRNADTYAEAAARIAAISIRGSSPLPSHFRLHGHGGLSEKCGSLW
jgi:hypothetical protein